MSAPVSTRVVLTVLAYVVTTFVVQGGSHFAVNADHYAAIPILRADPIVPLGFTSMLIQGSIFALLFPRIVRGTPTVRQGMFFSWALGGFLASYIALAEPGKYAIPGIGSWIGVEVTTAAVQYTLFGVLLGLIHQWAAARHPAALRPARS